MRVIETGEVEYVRYSQLRLIEIELTEDDLEPEAVEVIEIAETDELTIAQTMWRHAVEDGTYIKDQRPAWSWGTTVAATTAVAVIGFWHVALLMMGG